MSHIVSSSEAPVDSNLSLGAKETMLAPPVTEEITEEVRQAIQNITIASGINMKDIIKNKIDSLPPLPKTIIDINRLRNSSEPNNEELLKIILTDPMCVANILRVSNSAMYGFSRQIKTAQDALKMLGFKMTSNIAISTAIVGYLKPDLGPYGIDMDSFTGTSSLQSKIIDRWVDPKISHIKNELQFAAFLQEVGIIIISVIIIEKNLSQLFRDALKLCENQAHAEEIIFGQSSSEITSMIFSHWKFNQKMIDYIRNVDKPEKADELYKVGSQALKIAKTLAPVGQTGVTKESIAKANELVASYQFDIGTFKTLTDWIQDRAENA
ncbi:MAG: HDOD domain-containing protein [Candidatus Gracilibacteria bacterium]|nr:HDOD domain-containing protein [Candidatus Gracilibacteria bacterium]